ncbi:MAG: hypothetical protein ACJ0OP_03000 [Thermodesulfobacteriota bacterium]|nr:MAG: hypothetical protein EVA31_01240 [Candidatus Dadabacteria bacterium]
MSLDYLDFDSIQNVYDYQDETNFFPPSLITDSCFSRHLLINKYLLTRKPKYLFWSIEFDSNSLMDPFLVETVNFWKELLINSSNSEDKLKLLSHLKNIGLALSQSRDSNLSFHYDSGFVHYKGEKLHPLITFEVHPPRRCFRLIENFEEILASINKINLLKLDLESELVRKYNLERININFTNPLLIASQIISELHNKIPKNKTDKTELILTPFLAEKIYSDAVSFTEGLEYIVDTYRIVDYWDPDKKR